MFKLLQFSILLPLVPLLIGFSRRAKSNKLLWLLCLLLLASIILDIINAFLLPYLGISSLVGFHAFTAIEFTLYLFIFRQIIENSFLCRFIIWIVLAFWIYKLIDVTFLTGEQTFDSTATTIEAVSCIFFCLYFYHQTLQNLPVESLERYPPFWICAGILLYFSGNLLLFLFSSYILHQGYQYSLVHWSVHAIFSLLKYAAFSIGIWWINPTLKTSPS